MRNALTISLPKDLAKDLEASSKRRGKSRSEIVQNALRRDLFLEHLDESRRRLVPLARKRGLYTDEDIFKLIS